MPAPSAFWVSSPNSPPDNTNTETLMQAAVRRSLLESVAVYWMMLKSYQDEDYLAALHYADILLRTRSQAPAFVMPMLGKIAETRDASDKLKQLLATNPPWRPHVFFEQSFLSSISDARTPLDIMLSLKDTSNPPTANDLRTYLDFLIEHRLLRPRLLHLAAIPTRRATGRGRPFVQWQLRGHAFRGAVRLGLTQEGIGRDR